MINIRRFITYVQVLSTLTLLDSQTEPFYPPGVDISSLFLFERGLARLVGSSYIDLLCWPESLT